MISWIKSLFAYEPVLPQEDDATEEPSFVAPYRDPALGLTTQDLSSYLDKALQENTNLKEQLALYKENSDREAWRQGMKDAAAIVAARNYMLLTDTRIDEDFTLFGQALREVRERTRDELTKIIKRLADKPEDSILPMLPISPGMARRVGTLK